MGSKEPAEYLRLRDNHPTAQKMQKLWTLADGLGLHISFYGHRTIVTDSDFPGRQHDMHDLENRDEAVSDFPPACEYVLKYENPEYTEFCQERDEAILRRRKAEQVAAGLEAAERERKAEEEARRRIEEAERKTLASLKAKYEDV